MKTISDVSNRLAERAEAVCRQYLSNGKRHGRNWVIGDVYNTPGQSMRVYLQRLFDRPAGKWVDYATGEHGDLLDVIKLSLGLADMRDVIREAMDFLSLPQLSPALSSSYDKDEAIQRLWSMSRPVVGTLAARYLQSRGIVLADDMPALRFHPRCFFRSAENARQRLPAMIAAFTDGTGNLTGLHRTFLDAASAGKAVVNPQRKAMGRLIGSSIRFGTGSGNSAAQLVGEGIETVLSLRTVMPDMTMHAAGSASHLPFVPFDRSLRRLYIACDNDEAGEQATGRLLERAAQNGIQAIVLLPHQNDFNDDLRLHSADHLRNRLRLMLHPQDRHHLAKAG